MKYDQGGNANYSAAPQVVESVSPRQCAADVHAHGDDLGQRNGDRQRRRDQLRRDVHGDGRCGHVVTLTAHADSGSTFTGWSGACTGGGTCTVTMDAAKQVHRGVRAFDRRPAKKVYCVVPNVKGKTLAAAKRKLTAAHCKAGKTTTAKSKTVKKGNVISQSPKAGKKLAKGSKVNLVVSRGKR